MRVANNFFDDILYHVFTFCSNMSGLLINHVISGVGLDGFGLGWGLGVRLFCHWYFRADSMLAPSQWETSLQSNAVSHWLGANLESALYFIVLVALCRFFFVVGFLAINYDFTRIKSFFSHYSMVRWLLLSSSQSLRCGLLPSLSFGLSRSWHWNISCYQITLTS